jgi:DNA polymerase-4
MLYFARGSVTAKLSVADLRKGLFKALKLCPDAVIVKPSMSKYASVSRQIRERMLDLH